MSRRYSQEFKAAAVEQLRANHGNTLVTARQTGVPERTLRDWKREILLSPPPLPVPPVVEQNPASQPPEFDDPAEALRYVRDRIVRELVNLSTNLSDSHGLTTPYQRTLMLAQLTDRLMMLNSQPGMINEPIEVIIRNAVEKEDDLDEYDDEDELAWQQQERAQSPSRSEVEGLG
jgi:transposase-like protein